MAQSSEKSSVVKQAEEKDQLQNSPEKEQNQESRDKGIGRLFKKIGHGMKEVAKGVFVVVKEVAKVPVALIKGVDKGLSQVPLAGDIYRGGKQVIGGVWGVTEKIPVVGEITKGLRKGSATIGEKMGFTGPERAEKQDSENELMDNVRKIRDKVAEEMPEGEAKKILLKAYDDALNGKSDIVETMKGVNEKYPIFGKIMNDYLKGVLQWKTGKEFMTAEALVEEGKKLKEKMLTLANGKDVKEKGIIDEKGYGNFKKEFSNLPAFNEIDKNGKTYELLQNMYFSRSPKPDLKNPLVHEFIEKSIALSLASQDDKAKYAEVSEKHYELTKQKSHEIAAVFGFNEFEKTNLEYSLNMQERRNRLPPQPPEGYSDPDLGLQDIFKSTHKSLFPEVYAEEKEKKKDAADLKTLREYKGVALSVFQGVH